jgi:Rrf2 family nitric oxide-sensitive transcriptional repressor
VRFNYQTDYAFRVLIYLLGCDGAQATVGEIADAYVISANHLNKVVNRLAALGIIEARRGRGGGIRLLEEGKQWGLGRLARAMEPDCEVAQCTGSSGDCAIQRVCVLRGYLREAQECFYRNLDQRSVGELTGSASTSASLRKLLG